MTKSAAAGARPPSSAAPAARRRFAASSPSRRLVLVLELLSAASFLGLTTTVAAVTAAGGGAAAACINDTTTIFDAEAAVLESWTSDALRTYTLCSDTTYNIGRYNPRAARYEDGMAGLDVLQSNIHILCGDDGKRENGCVLRGGGEQVFIVNDENTDPPLTNVVLSGLTFRDAKDKFVAASARTKEGDEDGILFKDCVFEDGHNVTSVVDTLSFNGDGVPPGSMSLTFDTCTFRNNDVAAAIGGKLSTLIWNIDHSMTIRNCAFENNRVLAEEGEDTVTAVVINTKDRGSIERGGGTLSVIGSTFVNNTVSAALVYEESSTTTVGNNIAEQNTFFPTAATDESCEGLATFVPGTQGFEFDCLPFSVSWEPTMSPVVGGAPTTMAPTASPVAGEAGVKSAAARQGMLAQAGGRLTTTALMTLLGTVVMTLIGKY